MEYRIEDTGIGIKEEDIPKLFEEFERIELSRNRSIEGTGLGMSITMQLIKLMGGSLDVKSVYGEGSCFVVRIMQGIVDDTPIGNLSERIRKMQEASHRICFETANASASSRSTNRVFFLEKSLNSRKNADKITVFKILATPMSTLGWFFP